jgi:hypothetical protein
LRLFDLPTAKVGLPGGRRRRRRRRRRSSCGEY